MSQTNFLIGRGELLTRDIKGPKRKMKKAVAYTLERARERLSGQADNASLALSELPVKACPRDFGVARIVLNPSYIARSYFPSDLLRATGLESIGSRRIKVTPESWTRTIEPHECATTEIFVAGKRNAFRALSGWMAEVEEKTEEADDLTHIEKILAFEPSDRIVNSGTLNDKHFEFGIHLLPDKDSTFIQKAFVDYASELNLTVHTDLSFEVGNLWFVPVEGKQSQALKLSKFVFVRVIRPVPKMRGLLPSTKRSGPSVGCTLPTQDPLSSEPRVAILDAGLPDTHTIGKWLRNYRILDEDASDDPEGPEHGLAATSAFLFGPIEPEGAAARPYSYVDHLRVLDEGASLENPLELYRTLGHIEEVLLSRQYEFINLSVGPDVAIEDNDVHAWTSVIDDLLSDGNTFMTIAAGNNGDRDELLQFDRVQVPSDCVNAITVGAANCTSSTWARAPYSARGPGRSPGVIKPDLMAFGGGKQYFHALVPGKKPALVPLLGTSFAAPYILRSAVGVRAVLGQELSVLAIKALLVHAADKNGHETIDVGWGKVPEDLLDVITCPPGVARIVYQGELKPGKYIRAPLPLPEGSLTGMVNLKATFSFACATDPQDPASYTRAGLEVTFRPNKDKVNTGKADAKTKPFFEKKKFATEEERRSDSGKWETVLHDSKNMRGSTLNGATFDIHYNAREQGGTAEKADKIKYALIITVEAPKHPELYAEILKAYADTLVPIQPQISLPVRT
ncbi:S8 family peptidase [Pseudomonas sp. p1(2021b)]|uniref:S8 family peptidase n=1 Tax=Pseudomonas sp. p1(2021b) TaxID=2874628 RepID=UPI001CCD2159|nr:S8 family peptidase [Pseudomonas sp. p1(2021b)]UBM25245.1 S8 family peptidase [Pseudomonas sp. p1(2021b)]